MHIGFVLSAKAASSRNNFNTMKEIIANIIDGYGKERIRYSVVVFGDVPKVKLRFQDYFTNEEDMKMFVRSITNTLRGSALNKALEKARTQFDQAGGGEVKKVLVVITDKRSESTTESVTLASKLLKSDEIKVIPVALGTEADISELGKTTEDKRNLIDASKPPDFRDIAHKIMKIAIKGL